MKPAQWWFNASWRTLLAFFPQLARPDDHLAAQHLTSAEYALYCRMDRRDRAHACNVLLKLLELYPDAAPELRRAALLHDVGKVGRSYRALTRILAGVYTPRAVPAAPRLAGIRGAWQLKKHHPAYGADLIVAAGGGARVAEIVRRHHAPAGDADAERLGAADAYF